MSYCDDACWSWSQYLRQPEFVQLRRDNWQDRQAHARKCPKVKSLENEEEKRQMLTLVLSRQRQSPLTLLCNDRIACRSLSYLRPKRSLASVSAFRLTSETKRFATGRNVNSSKGSFTKIQCSSYSTESSPISTNVVYQGPLSRTFRSLKIFSLSSLGLASALTPFMFVIDTSLPNIARAALAVTAMATSGVSTGLVGWCGQPYVTTIRTLGGSPAKSVDGATQVTEGIQLETLTLTLKPRFTSVYDTSFLTETKRPMAKWELAETVSSNSPSSGEPDSIPQEETVAETMDAEGRILGRWIVSWNDDRSKGICRGEGKIQRYAEFKSFFLVFNASYFFFYRYFNVHEELVPPTIR